MRPLARWAGAMQRPDRLLFLAILLAVALVPVFTHDAFLALMGGIVAFNAVMALTATLLVGYGGQFSFGFPIFVGVGAYVSTWCLLQAHTDPLVGVAAGGLSAVVAASVVSFPAMRIRGLQLGVATMALVLSGDEIFSNVGGFNGIVGIPPLRLGGIVVGDPTSKLAVYVVLFAACYVTVTASVTGRFGRLLLIMKADEDTAASLGLNVFWLKQGVFALHALLLGVLGGFYPLLLGYVGPSLFSLDLALNVFLAAVLGGLLFPEGALLGSLAFSLIPLLAGNYGQIEPIVLGALLLVVLIVLPRGLMGLVVHSPQREDPSRSPAATSKDAASQPRASDVMDVVPPAFAAQEPVLAVSGIAKRFGGLTALRGVAFDLRRGEILGLIGNNGAGKSTLINICCGYLAQDMGHVAFRGRGVDRWSPHRRAQAGLLRTFQFPVLAAEMSVLENLVVAPECMHPFRVDRGRSAEALSLLATLGLDRVAHAPIGQLSLGLQKVVDVARALMTAPTALLLDEPAAGLSPSELPFMRSALLLARRQGTSLLIVEHNIPFVSRLVDRLVVLDFGSVLTEGSPAEVLHSSAVIDAYLGRAPAAPVAVE